MLNFLTVHPFVERYEMYLDMQLIEADPDDNIFANCAFASGSILATTVISTSSARSISLKLR